jgi:hypothetical protein
MGGIKKISSRAICMSYDVEVGQKGKKHLATGYRVRTRCRCNGEKIK